MGILQHPLLEIAQQYARLVELVLSHQATPHRQMLQPAQRTLSSDALAPDDIIQQALEAVTSS